MILAILEMPSLTLAEERSLLVEPLVYDLFCFRYDHFLGTFLQIGGAAG